MKRELLYTILPTDEGMKVEHVLRSRLSLSAKAIRRAKFLDDGATYLGNQLHNLYGGSRCFGIAAGMQFLLVCTYGPLGEDPELVLYKQR